MYLNNIADVAEKLAERYDGPTYEVNKGAQGTFTYVPWTESVELLDQVFGVFGWSASAPQIVSNNGFVHVSFGITVRVADEDGNVVEKTVPAVGSAAERDDNAAKSAFSDAFNKGVKLLGDKFARFLSKEGKANRQAQSNGYQRSTSPAANYGANGNGNGARQPFTGQMREPGAPATENQLKLLRMKGVAEGQLQGLTKQDASEMIETLKGQGF